ncbi:MAG: PAS domain-containing protein [Caldilineaceae bacterium]|nr:PAS domain-containing protein [Caldilineaceae bacterium]
MTSDVWLSLITAAVLTVLGLYSWQRSGVPGARPFAVVCLFSLLWLLGIAGEAAATAVSTKIAWHKFQMIWHMPTATALACFALAYVRPGQWLTRSVLIGLSIPALLMVVLYLTNDLHHWVWRELVVGDAIRPDYAVLGWIIGAYALALALVQAGAFGWLFVHSPQHRVPVLMMLLSVVLTRATLLFDIFHLPVGVASGWEALVFLQAAVIYAIALFGLRIFDPVPAAYRTVVAQMQTGILVFDGQGRIENLNPAAEQMLGVRSGDARGKSWAEVAPSAAQALTFAPTTSRAVAVERAAAEFALGDGPQAHCYVSTVSPLRDGRGLVVGHLLSLNDVTEERRVQAQMLEQQQALAALHEREQLARELHDTVGQVLGYAGLQVSTVGQLVQAGETSAATGQLDRLEHVLHDAHADLREQILNLRTASLLNESFFEAIRHYIDGFRDNYGINVRLTVARDLDERVISAAAQVQLFRIMQEALSNARKHAAPQRVDVRFAADAASMCMLVEDDGCGFDMRPDGAADGDHFGLRFMAERVQAVDGALRIESAPGAGTRIAVEIPRKEM